MKAFPMPACNIPQYVRIGNLIPQNSFTVVTGLQGTGKSYSICKFLNIHNIAPLIVNLDKDPTLQSFAYTGMTTDNTFVKHLLNGDYDDLAGHTVVLDTYTRIVNAYGKLHTDVEFQKEIAEKLLTLPEQSKCTVILVAHNEAYVSKGTIALKDNPLLLRNCHEHLHFEKFKPTGVKAAETYYRMSCLKGRGIAGDVDYENWMREPVINPLTNTTI